MTKPDLIADTQITQEDREAAAEAYTELTGRPTSADQMGGDWLARRFASHRITAERRGAEAAIEAAAKVADKHRESRLAASAHAKERGERQEARDFESMAIECAHIAAAIRALDPAAVGSGESAPPVAKPAWAKIGYAEPAHLVQKRATTPAFPGYVIGWYQRLDGPRGYVMQHERDRIVHVNEEPAVAAGFPTPPNPRTLTAHDSEGPLK